MRKSSYIAKLRGRDNQLLGTIARTVKNVADGEKIKISTSYSGMDHVTYVYAKEIPLEGFEFDELKTRLKKNSNYGTAAVARTLNENYARV